MRSVILRLGYHLYPVLAKKDYKALVGNIQRVYELPPGSHFSNMCVRQTLRHQLHLLMDMLMYLPKPESIPLKLSANAAEFAAPAIYVTAHVGSWDLCAYAIARYTRQQIAVLAKPAKYSWASDLLEELRGQFGARVLWTNRKSLLKDMLKTLDAGHSLGFVMDQKPDGRKGINLEFLGQTTEFVSGPAAIAIRTKAPVIAIFCLRNSDGTYTLDSERIDTASGDETAITTACVRAMETRIRAFPEQWAWNYRRWRSEIPAKSFAISDVSKA